MDSVHGFFVVVKTDEGNYRSPQRYEDFNHAYNSAIQTLKTRHNAYEASIYHTADYEDFKTRRLTTISY